MPVMDGYEACRLIFYYLTSNHDRLPSEVPLREGHLETRASKTLIICLSSDCSPEASFVISQHPFDSFIGHLTAEDVENIKE
jgi:hypothetical protein